MILIADFVLMLLITERNLILLLSSILSQRRLRLNSFGGTTLESCSGEGNNKKISAENWMIPWL